MRNAPCVTVFQGVNHYYEYDVRDAFDRYLDGNGSLNHWLDLLNFQDFSYPDNYNKLRFLENYDTPRIASRVKSPLALENYTALLYFLKGTTLLYAGQEKAMTHAPGLFDADLLQWDIQTDLSSLLRSLYSLKHDTLSPDDLFFASADEEHHIAVIVRDDGRTRKIGVFSLQGDSGESKIPLPDGTYQELLRRKTATVSDGRLWCDGRPMWICAPVNLES